jgi:hypothetical protein
MKALDKVSILTILAYSGWPSYSHPGKITRYNNILEMPIDYIGPVFLSRFEVNLRFRGTKKRREMTHGIAKAKSFEITAR